LTCPILTFFIPAFVVAICCIISIVVLSIQKHSDCSRQLQRSRNRASLTIFLFAIVFGICNYPMVVMWVIDKNLKYTRFLSLNAHMYLSNATTIVLLAANSAVNSVLYFWRMRRYREFVLSGIRRILL
jgi:hypothetical protein